MKVLAFLVLFASLLTISGCVSKYASEKAPVVITVPDDLNEVKLAKRVLYSLAYRGWTIENFDLEKVDAVYREIPIRVEMTSRKTVSINHREGGMTSRGNAKYLRRWIPKFQQTLSHTFFSEEDDINVKLKSCGISPSRVEKLAAKLEDK